LKRKIPPLLPLRGLGLSAPGCSKAAANSTTSICTPRAPAKAALRGTEKLELARFAKEKGESVSSATTMGWPIMSCVAVAVGVGRAEAEAETLARAVGSVAVEEAEMERRALKVGVGAEDREERVVSVGVAVGLGRGVGGEEGAAEADGRGERETLGERVRGAEGAADLEMEGEGEEEGETAAEGEAKGEREGVAVGVSVGGGAEEAVGARGVAVPGAVGRAVEVGVGEGASEFEAVGLVSLLGEEEGVRREEELAPLGTCGEGVGSALGKGVEVPVAQELVLPPPSPQAPRDAVAEEEGVARTESVGLGEGDESKEEEGVAVSDGDSEDVGEDADEEEECGEEEALRVSWGVCDTLGELVGSGGVALAVALEGEEEDGEGDAWEDALVDPQELGVNVALCVAEEEGVEEAVAPPSKEAEGEPEALLPTISLGVGDTVELAHEEGAALELPSAGEGVGDGVALPVGASGVGEMDGEDDCDTVPEEEVLGSGEGEVGGVGVEENVAGNVASDVVLGREEAEGEKGMLAEGVKEGDGDCERLAEEVRDPPPPPAIVAVA
jgi:hypothetical protein